MRQNWRWVLAFMAIFFATRFSCAVEAPQVKVQLGETEIYLGESVEYQVTLQNIKSVSTPDMSAFAADFTVVAQGDRSMNSSSIIIINGQIREQSAFGHVFAFKLTPKRAGELIVPAPTTSIDGRQISGNPLALRVIAQEKQDLVVMELVTSKTQIYPTQPFDVTLRILIKPLPKDNQHDPLAPLQQAPALDINWLQPPAGLDVADLKTWLNALISRGGSGFSINNLTYEHGFFETRHALFNLAAGREIRAGLTGEKIEYFVYELKREFTPQKTGSYQFGPATLKGNFVDGLTGRRYTTRRLVLAATPKTIEVIEVPAPRPPTFCGGIGPHLVSASANPTTLRIGDPLTLTLKIQKLLGAGSLDLISAPNLASNAQLVEGFEIIDQAPTGDIKNDTKCFSYGLRLKKSGVNIPALTVTFFNPETAQFTDSSVSQIKLNISSSAPLKASELVGVVPAGRPREIRVSEQGAFQNITNVSELADQRVDPWRYVVGAGAAWLIYGGLWWCVTRHRHRANDAIWQRRRYAQRDALQRLKAAHAAIDDGKTADAIRHARSAIVELIGDMLNLPATGMTAREADVALAQAAIAEQIRARAVGLLESIETAEYGLPAAQDVRGLLTNTESTLLDLRRELDAKI
ncbi:MAG: BatD family protein [Planctomycetota bacterium]